MTASTSEIPSPTYRLLKKPRRMRSMSWAPKAWLSSTPTPMLVPIISEASSRISGIVQPTAARASTPRIRPTTMLSVRE